MVCTCSHGVLLQSVSSVMSIKKCQGVKQVAFAVGPFPHCGFPQYNSPFCILLLSLSRLTWFQFIRWPFSSSEQGISSCPATNLDSLEAPVAPDLWKALLSSLQTKCLCPGAGGRTHCWGGGTHRALMHHTPLNCSQATICLFFGHIFTQLLHKEVFVSSWKSQPVIPISLFDTDLSFKFACISFYRFSSMNQSCLFVFKENTVYYKLWILFQICLQSLQTVIVAFSKLFQAQGNIWLSIALGW